MTTVEHDTEPCAVEIQSLPREYLDANHLLAPSRVARHLGREYIANTFYYDTGGQDGENVLAGLVYLLLTAPEVLTSSSWLEWDDASSPQQFGQRGVRREQDQFAEFARYVIRSPIVPAEESWPTAKAMTEIAGVGGGTGLGVLIAAGALPPIALLTVPAGIIAIGVAWRARGRLGDLVDPVSRKIRVLDKLRREGAITQAQYDDAINKLLGHFTLPSEPVTP